MATLAIILWIVNISLAISSIFMHIWIEPSRPAIIGAIVSVLASAFGVSDGIALLRGRPRFSFGSIFALGVAFASIFAVSLFGATNENNDEYVINAMYIYVYALVTVQAIIIFCSISYHAKSNRNQNSLGVDSK